MRAGFNGFPGYTNGKGRQKVPPAIPSAAVLDLRAYDGKLVHVSGTATVTTVLPPPSGECLVIFDSACTLTHNASTLILPGATNISTVANDAMLVCDDATAVRVLPYSRPIGNHAVAVHTGNGRGSTNTAIRRYTTIATNVGTAITYADTAAAGASFTINEDGMYAILMSDVAGGTTYNIAGSLNSTNLTTSADSLTGFTERMFLGVSAGAGVSLTCGGTFRLSAGDVVRPHISSSAAVNNTSNNSMFSIRKVGLV